MSGVLNAQSRRLELGAELPPPHYERTDFTINGRYPSDRYGEEVAADARVWRIYRDECTKRDDHTVITWNDTLDVLLIFVRKHATLWLIPNEPAGWSILCSVDGVHHRELQAHAAGLRAIELPCDCGESKHY